MAPVNRTASDKAMVEEMDRMALDGVDVNMVVDTTLCRSKHTTLRIFPANKNVKKLLNTRV
jgi:hypothetical protein